MSRCPVVYHVDRLTAPLQASRSISRVVGSRGWSGPTALPGLSGTQRSPNSAGFRGDFV